jgi:hypothetical protein
MPAEERLKYAEKLFESPESHPKGAEDRLERDETRFKCADSRF